MIDAQSDNTTFTGPTDLRTRPAKLAVQQVGMYAVAEAASQGVFGVGPHGKTTWFVPGEGIIHENHRPSSNTAPLTLASQNASGRGSSGNVVFSLSDGTVIAPELDAGAEQQRTVVYPGGFAAEIALDAKRTEIQFFDDSGKRSSQVSIEGVLSTDTRELPIIDLVGGGWAVYTPDGATLLEAPGATPGDNVLIGSRLFVSDKSDSMQTRWQQYDLRTGQQGAACDGDMAGYLGSDGTVGVFEDGNPNVGLVTEGRVLATCDTLWTLTSPVGAFRDVWRINTTLVELSDTGTELMSLVAPR